MTDSCRTSWRFLQRRYGVGRLVNDGLTWASDSNIRTCDMSTLFSRLGDERRNPPSLDALLAGPHNRTPAKLAQGGALAPCIHSCRPGGALSAPVSDIGRGAFTSTL